MAGLRIGGLASGMDIDQIVGDLMKAERLPLDKLAQKKQFLEWQRDDYREMNKTLLEMDRLTFDGVLKQGSYTKKKYINSNPDAVSIRNLNSTVDFSGTIKVNDLASAASMFSKDKSIIDPTQKLGASGVFEQTIKIRAIGKDGKLDQGINVAITTEDTIYTIVDKINKTTGVNAYFDEAAGKLSLIAKNTGDASYTDTTGTKIDTAEIELSNVEANGNFWTILNMHSDNVAAATDVAKYGEIGKNANMLYNGMEIVRSSNIFNINGVEFTLKAQTTEPVTFTSTTDTDAILETIVKFVDTYNSLIEKMKNEMEEKRHRDFQPLSKEQKEAMDEKDIERWEEKARSGTLRGDSILSGALNKMRIDLYSKVSGITGKNQLAEIGIKTSSNYSDGGKLIIDPDKLAVAIAENPNTVYQIFSNEGTGDSQGIGLKLRETIQATMKNIEKRAGNATSISNTYTLGRNLDSLDDQIDGFEERLIKVENRYWRQFTAMEKAIQRSNSQSAYLMQQFGGM